MSDEAEHRSFFWRASNLVRGIAHSLYTESEESKVADAALPFLRTGRVVATGTTITLSFILGFLGWAAFAPLDSALVAPGVVVVESHRKTIQHLEGGIVKEILVHDGQQVKAGQTLIVLDDTQARVNLELLQDEADELTAQEARLNAERDGAAQIVFPPDLLARQSDPKVDEAIRVEEKTFQSRKDSLDQQIGVLTSRKGENERVIAGLKDEQTALETQIALIAQETTSVQLMVNKGLEPVPKLLALQRQAADLTGQRGQLIEKISQVDLNNGENNLQIVNLKSQQLDEVLKDLSEVQGKRFDLMDRIQAEVHTKGAVIKPGDTVAEIVPENDQLEVEAHVKPEDADDVYVGMAARVNLSAYKQRRLPMILGTVTGISPDRITDPHTEQSYFNALISVDRAALKPYPEARIIPGMPVEVAMQTGAHTALDYFIEPIRAVLRNGMREK